MVDQDPQRPVRRVVQVFKNHLDVGFTESAAKVTHDAIRWMLGVAADTARRLRLEHGEPRFVWTVPAWIADEALRILDGDALRAVERGLAEGDIAWHALPFTTHTELMDEALCAAACAVSARLDRRFGRTTRAAKMTDVPGHARGLVTVLARCGIDVLHVGINGMSAMPDVPPAFRWADGLGNDLVVAYEDVYGAVVRLPGDDQVLSWRMVGDNMEVPSIADIAAVRADDQARYPGAEIVAGRLDDWAAGIRARAAGLPVVTAEIGDTWIHGTGSDPWKTQRFRALTRLRSRWLADGRLTAGDAVDAAIARPLLLVAEHTWGVAIAGHTHHDRVHWRNADFARVRGRGCWRVAEASWLEQRDYVGDALAAMPAPLRAQADAAIAELDPRFVATADWTPVADPTRIALGRWRLALDPTDGSIASLLGADGRERVAAGGRLARLRYQAFGADDCRRFVRQYCRGGGDHLLSEFTKDGLDAAGVVGGWWDPSVIAVRRNPGGDAVAIDLAFPALVVTEAGAPAAIQLVLRDAGGALACRVAWRGKHPTRLPEALWWGFQPAVDDPLAWRLDKLGQAVDPTDVVSRGARGLHGVGKGAWNDGSRERVRLRTLDAHLIAVGRPRLYDFDDLPADPAGGLHLNLVNNLWGTNFPMWCGDDLAFRVELAWGPAP